jgi:type II secretory pathway predicted ATPase ExeA
MYLQHFGLKHDPLGKSIREAVSTEQQKSLHTQLNWLLETRGLGLITGDAGVGKTVALREWSKQLNLNTHKVFYQADNHFRPFDIYSQFAEMLGIEKHYRYSSLWRAIKSHLLDLYDNKHITPIWILDEAHHLPTNFLLELPAFLNFSFDSKEVLIIILVGHTSLQSILTKTYYNALTSRVILQFHWNAINEFQAFNHLITEAFKNAGVQTALISQTGLQLIYMASKGTLRFAHKILTHGLQIAAEKNINHLSDDIIKHCIEAEQQS